MPTHMEYHKQPPADSTQLKKLSVAQRIELLCDPESFVELGAQVASFTYDIDKKVYHKDGIVTGFATIQGQTVALYVQDFTVKGGSLGRHHAQKIYTLMDKAATIGCPIIGLLDSGGARITEGVHALAGYGEIFKRNVRYSGVIPQISVILGPCAGGAVYSPALTDIIFAVDQISQLFITGPQVIAQAVGEQIDKEQLGGTHVHSTQSGVIHRRFTSEEHCFAGLKRLLSYLPANYKSAPPVVTPLNAPDTDISALLPTEHARAYDVKKLIENLVDTNSFFELQPAFAPNIVTGFARFAGNSVGIIANQPHYKAGTLDIDASCKGARFIQLCNNFDLPVVSLVDVPGFLPGVAQEHNGIIRHGAKLLHAYAQATCPLITIITRKAFGGAYIVMGSKQIGADFVYAWPEAHIAVLGPKTAISILHRRASDEEKKILEKQYESTYLNPDTAARYGYIDGIITPEQTRKSIIKSIQLCANKVVKTPDKKSTNPPL